MNEHTVLWDFLGHNPGQRLAQKRLNHFLISWPYHLEVLTFHSLVICWPFTICPVTGQILETLPKRSSLATCKTESARPLGALSAKIDQACLRTISCWNTVVAACNNHSSTAIKIIALLVTYIQKKVRKTKSSVCGGRKRNGINSS